VPAAVVLVGLTGTALPVVVLPVLRPSADLVVRADAVVLLSGDQGNRLAVAMRLLGDGVAPVLVVAGEADRPQTKEFCRTDPGFEVVCLLPQPDRTETEARAVGQLARSRGWGHVTVVTDPVHFARARLLFRRCLPGKVAVVGDQPPTQNTPRAWLHEITGLAFAKFVARKC